MSRARKPLPELKPIYVRPQLDKRMRQAEREYCHAAFSGSRRRPMPGTFDPLRLRMGMRANNINQRAGWVVSNPLYDQTLSRHPHLDPSLPGPGWLREIYHSRMSSLVCLPGVAAVIAKRNAEQRLAASPPAPKPSADAEVIERDQLELFA